MNISLPQKLMKLCFFTLLVAAMGAPYIANAQVAYTELPETELVGNTYRTIITDTFKQCQNACTTDTNCRALTWCNKTTCSLKDGFDARKFNPNCESAIKTPPALLNLATATAGNYVELLDTRLSGTTYRNIITDTFKQCQNACTTDTNCKALSWNKNNQGCSLKTNAGTRTYDPNYDSAIKVAGATAAGSKAMLTSKTSDCGGGKELKNTLLLDLPYKYLFNQTYQQCKEACAKDGHCKGLSWNKFAQTCSLKASCAYPMYNLAYDSFCPEK